MKSNTPPPGVVRHRGLSFLELTVVLAILLALISILFIGARAWRRDSDRSCCVLTLRNLQVAARSYQNMYGYNYGSRPDKENGTQDIAEHLYMKGYISMELYRQTRGAAPCPSGGVYTCPRPDMFPQAGDLYMLCSRIVTEDHRPDSHADW